jgi:hypothetical protein
MKLKIPMFCLYVLTTAICYGQQVVVREMIDVTNDLQLQLPDKNIGITFPLYIANENEITYQGQDSIKHFTADGATFRLFAKDKYRDRALKAYFALDKYGVYFKGKLIKADTTGFKIFTQIDWAYGLPIIWKTNNVVCVNEKVYSLADAASFQLAFPLKNEYFKDRNHLYYFDYNTNKFSIMEGADPAAATLCEIFVCDKNRVYFSGKIYYTDGEELQPVNAVLKKTSNAVYRYTDRIAQGIDPATITAITRYFAKDKNNVYWYDKVLPLKPDKLGNIKFWDGAYRAYYSNDKQVYDIQGNLHPEYDAKSFGILTGTEICYDKNGIYSYTENPLTRKYGFYKIPFRYVARISDQNAFISADGLYIVYDRQAYSSAYRKIYDLTAEEVKLIRKTPVELQFKRIPNAVYYQYYYKRDGKVYWNNKPIDVDGTFEALGQFYKDKNHVYANDQKGAAILKDVDVASAKIWNGLLVDKNYLYTYGHRLIKSDQLELLRVFNKYETMQCEGLYPASQYYVFKNTDGYWLVHLTDIPKARNLGKNPGEDIQKILSIMAK